MIDLGIMRNCGRRADRLIRAAMACQADLDRLLVPLPPMLPPQGAAASARIAPADASEEGILAYAVGQRIRFERMRRRWRQGDLAVRTGIARPNVARLERGLHLPAMSTLARVAAALGVDLQELLRPPSASQEEVDADRGLAEAGLDDYAAQMAEEDAG
jgi:transcriptional regulator with XRE-family HTH domain